MHHSTWNVLILLVGAAAISYFTVSSLNASAMYHSKLQEDVRNAHAGYGGTAAQDRAIKRAKSDNALCSPRNRFLSVC